MNLFNYLPPLNVDFNILVASVEPQHAAIATPQMYMKLEEHRRVKVELELELEEE